VGVAEAFQVVVGGEGFHFFEAAGFAVVAAAMNKF